MDTKVSTPHPESWRLELLVKLFPKILRSMPGCEIVERNIQVDHINLLMFLPPKYAISDVVGRIKGITSRRLRKKLDWLKKYVGKRT